MLEAGANWLGVNALDEALELKESGIQSPIYIMGYIALDELAIAVENGFHFVVYNKETLQKLVEICKKIKPALTHLKLETGNYRQGVLKENLEEILQIYRANPMVQLEGLCTHFSNIEDTTDPSYANFQLQNFKKMVEVVENAGFKPKYKHCANTAATLLFEDTYFNMVRTGIGNYGMWPSTETMVSTQEKGLKTGENSRIGGDPNLMRKIELKPVLTWKTKIAQIKDVPEGGFIGYGCTYKADRKMRLAILPIGYYDSYRRELSNKAHVLVHGKRAQVRGRVCMNITMVDVTNIPEAVLEDEVVLLGAQGAEVVSAEQLAKWLGTINYEVTTAISERLERRVV